MRAGTEQEARVALEFESYGQEQIWVDPKYPYELPLGWKYLGSGSSRTCFLSPGGWVYKIENENARIKHPNMAEYHNYARCIKIAIKNWYMPRITLYGFDNRTVLAMEYICGEMDSYGEPGEDHFNPAWNIIQELWGIRDLADDNVILMATGQRALIDYEG